MCGISGIFSLSGKTIDNIENRINLMSKLLNHRGPDQSGVYISEKKNFALANNRLSILVKVLKKHYLIKTHTAEINGVRTHLLKRMKTTRRLINIDIKN
tara:strand:- start:3522 stop:3818 length:297 start_codon:yes stop_codon:yes gene_type:complete